MENNYAQALWQAVERGLTPAKAVHGLRDALVRQRRERLMPKIARAFERLAERERSRKGLVLYVAREKDGREAASAVTEVLEQMKAAATEFDVKIDDSLIGGWRLEGAGILVDRSYRKQLLEMYNRAIS